MNTPKSYKYSSYVEALKVLSPREIEVMDLVILGYTSFEIAKSLNLSKHTVNTHKKNITCKLDLEGSMAIIKWRASLLDQSTIPITHNY